MVVFLKSLDAAQVDAENFDGVAVEDGDDGACGSHTLKRQGRPLRD